MLLHSHTPGPALPPSPTHTQVLPQLLHLLQAPRRVPLNVEVRGEAVDEGAHAVAWRSGATE